MKDVEQLLRGVHARPDDDGRRLVLADWLDEHGDEHDRARAELIRVQCALEKLPRWDARRFDLEVREEALMHDHGAAWLSALPWPHCDFKLVPSWWTCRRGLLRVGLREIDDVRPVLEQGGPWLWVDGLGTDAYSGLADAVHVPQIAAVDLRENYEASNNIETLSRAGHAKALLELKVHGPGTAFDSSAHAVAEARGLKSLTRLELTGTNLGPTGAAALARSAVLSKVRYLDLSDNDWVGFHDGQGVRSLARSKQLGAVTTLKLRKIQLHPSGLAALARSQLFKQLHELDLSANIVGPNTLAPVLPARGKVLPLTDWDLTGCCLGEADIVAIADSRLLSGLRRLALSGNRLGKRGGRALLDSPHLVNLAALSLGDSGLKAADVARLAARSASAALVSLELANNALRSRSAQALANSPHLRGLVHLSLSHNPIEQAGLEAVLSLPGLCRLELAGCKLGGVAIEALARSPALARLVQLDLSGNRLLPRGAEALAASVHARGLLELRLAGTAIGSRGVAALLRSKNLPALRRLDLRENALRGQAVIKLFRDSPLSAQLTEIRLERNGFSRGEACQLHEIFGKRLRAALY